MTLSFTLVTPEELDRAFEDPEWAAEQVDDEERPNCFLEKSWAGIQFLLTAADVDVDLYEDGDPIDEECTLLGWGQRKVAKTAELLGAVPFEVLEGHYDPQALSKEGVYPMRHLWSAEDVEYLRENYAELVEFFTRTAASGGAAIRDFSF